MAELVPGLEYREFVSEAVRHRTESRFRRSPFFARVGPALEHLLRTPRIDRDLAPVSPPDRESPLRVVHWNIEKGRELRGLVHALRSHPLLKDAALLSLNEVDVGTARCGNADVGRELARSLGCHCVYLPSFIECTKGVREDLRAEGENEIGLHGLAILSRLPVVDARMIPLPPCHDYFAFHEKRLGFRQGLFVLVEWKDRRLIMGTTHLEVRRTPRCRARQFADFLRGIAEAGGAWGEEAPVIIAGDWNTNSFPRSGLLDAARGFIRIVRTPEERLDLELAQPFGREPLFDDLRRAGFALEPFNDLRPTASQVLSSVEDLGLIPFAAARWLSRRYALADRTLRMRLDWIAARGLNAAGPPHTVEGLRFEGRPVSDHAPIVAEIG